jgi:rsbT co-antagonist protein RsbR
MSELDLRLGEVRELVETMVSGSSAGSQQLPGEGDTLARVMAGLSSIAFELTSLRDSAKAADRRLTELSQMIASIVAFDYTPRVEISEKGDVYDGFGSCLNMMAEELAATTISRAYVDNIFQSMGDPLVVLDPAGKIRTVNRSACELAGRAEEALVGQPIGQLLPAIALDDAIQEAGVTVQEAAFRSGSGKDIPVSVATSVMRNRMGEVDSLVCVAHDLSDSKRVEEERYRAREAMQRQAILVEELSTPLIPITDEILVMPLIGTVDQERSERIIETLLQGVVSRQAKLAIIDVTGVLTMDQSAIHGITRAVTALRLVGAEVMVTGIRPEMAVTMVNLAADLTGVTTCGSLQSGIVQALRRLELSGGGRPKTRGNFNAGQR